MTHTLNTFTDTANAVFARAVAEYHVTDHVDAPCHNPHPDGCIEHDLYQKAWIDAVQWHLEDLIRDPDIDPADALVLKRRIDRSNQERTDLVERIDSYFWQLYHNVQPQPEARINTESPAWAVDRLSILHLKRWHMLEQVNRTDVSPEHHERCADKMRILDQQFADLTDAISQLLADYADGRCIMRVYKQMKMYNDPSLNPVLYTAK